MSNRSRQRTGVKCGFVSLGLLFSVCFGHVKPAANKLAEKVRA